MPILEIKNLKKYFGRTKAVDDISFSIEKGEIFGFLGPNGAGKTTTIRTIMGFLHPDSGKITISGHSTDEKDYYISLKNIGYLLSASSLVDNWSGLDHIRYFESIKGKSSNVEELIKRLEYSPKIKVKTLSTGNKQKLSLILALMNNPKLLVLDEPTTGLDPLLQDEFFKIVKEYKQNGSTILISSHNLNEVERLCSKVAMIKSGKLIDVDSVAQIKNKKIQTIAIEFNTNIDFDDIKIDGLSLVNKVDGLLTLNLQGDIDSFIKKVSSHKIKSLHINSASLEEIFLQYYKD